MPPELDQPGLVGVQLQTELRESLTKVGKEPPRVLLVLEAGDNVVRKTHNDHVAVREATSPLLHPQVEDVVQVHVREQRRRRIS